MSSKEWDEIRSIEFHLKKFLVFLTIPCNIKTFIGRVGPTWKFKLDPKLKDALQRMQNDDGGKGGGVGDYGLVSRAANEYARPNMSTSSTVLLPSKRSSLPRWMRAAPSNAIPAVLYSGTLILAASYWTFKLYSLRHRPGHAAERRAAEHQKDNLILEWEKTVEEVTG